MGDIMSFLSSGICELYKSIGNALAASGIFYKFILCDGLTEIQTSCPVYRLVCISNRARGSGFDNILSFLLLLIQKGQLSVTGESMCTKYWLTA